MEIPLALNSTQAAAAQLNLDYFLNTSIIPSFLLESFLFGAICFIMLFGLGIIWGLRNSCTSSAKIPTTIGIVLAFGGFTTHWILGLRQIGQMLSGIALNWPAENINVAHLAGLNSLLMIVIDQVYNAPEFLLTTIAETVFFGLSSMLFLVAFCIIMRSKNRIFSIRSSVVPCCSCLMFSISTVHWSLQLYYLENGNLCLSGCSAVDNTRLYNSILVAKLVLLYINIILSDIVVLWRVYAAWDQRRWVLIVCIVLSLSTIASTVVFLVIYTIPYNGFNPVFSNTLISSELNVKAGFDGSIFGTVVQTTSLLSNVLATVLIAFKAWRHRWEITVVIRTATRRTMVERVLALLVDSGMVYSCIWVLYIVASNTSALDSKAPRLNITIQDEYNSVVVQAQAIFDGVMVHVTAMYPTILIILIALGKIQHQERITNTTTVKAPQPASQQLVTVAIDIDIERNAGTASDAESESESDTVFAQDSKAGKVG